MSSNRAEEEIGPMYGLLFILYVTSAVCLGLPFYHWKASFEIQKDYGCILYAIKKDQKMEGSNNSGCILAFIVPIFLAMYSLGMGLYHINEVFGILKPATATEATEPASTSAGSEVPVTRKPPWGIFAIFGAFVVMITFAHVLFCTIGYYKTCTRYDDYVVQELNITGVEAELIRNRLSCIAIYSYMDYIHTAPNVHRDRMMTGLCLMIGLLSSFSAVICWVLVHILLWGQTWR